MPSSTSPVATAFSRVADAIADKLDAQFLSLGSYFSLASLACALVVAVVFLLARRGGRPVRAKVLVRALFPRRWLAGPSSKADLGFFLFNTFLAGALFGAAILSAKAIAGAVSGGLGAVFGPVAAGWAPAPLCAAVATIALFLAYELAYWLDHFLSHKIPFLWAFHKAHHTAQTLSPLTNFRVHPVDSLVFANMMAVFTGVTGGVLIWAFGKAGNPLQVSGANLIFVAFVFATVHLQHSHVWIAWRGVWGRILLSPAHHQIHHSANPEHFDRNFGSCLSVWDWAFGTLHMPALKRERLVFGVEGAVSPHTITGGLITPLAEAARTFMPAPLVPRRQSA